jgi:hypothetical protein
MERFHDSFYGIMVKMGSSFPTHPLNGLVAHRSAKKNYYPTDDKLYERIIKRYWGIADDKGIDLRQSYRRVLKELNQLSDI